MLTAAENLYIKKSDLSGSKEADIIEKEQIQEDTEVIQENLITEEPTETKKIIGIPNQYFWLLVVAIVSAFVTFILNKLSNK